MIRPKEEWKKQLEAGLPPKNELVQRNKAITAHYANWYLENQQWFKWAGMAAFASYQVGVALALSELLYAPDGMVAKKPKEETGFFTNLFKLYGFAFDLIFSIPVALHDFATRQLLLNDLDEIKNGNDEIFGDIAWAHAAYLEGGIKEIEANVSEREREYMLAGFKLIDEGAALLKQNKDVEKARQMIREGNVKLLRHEQLNTLQPIFDRISPLGKIVVSFGSALDFEGALAKGEKCMASFSEHFGYTATLTGAKSVTNPENRWQWIEENVLPIWKKVDEGYAENSGLKARLTAMAAKEPTMLQQVSGFANTIYPVLGLRG
ncbi:conserved hypothetical protein [Chloroherpeton thalassium ATCC 35110]|uniref:Uncharacterized protein n=1 Tax=Chloroherpeton thalassium (strain ATCC 35110 / GB-78) TaxID=517418 RepID=B3QT48_CHLT3|nr:hypothetical protein [Chloroherpeton thalassium]ACF14147.1 conserved hypothetical protein [Chloroherpeton thalassium ATCC 35110]